jgi:protein-S-isoprenylcysteine O-methyltransferase Ste14
VAEWAGAAVAIVVFSVVAMFRSGNLSSGRCEDTKNRWILLPFLILGFVLAWLPPYTDRRDLDTIGVLVSLLLVPTLVARMNAGEALLASEFGERYAEYRRRTWRLLPFIY